MHPVFSCCVERALASMWHPGRDEELQQRTVEQWQRKEAQGDYVASESNYVTSKGGQVIPVEAGI